MKKFNILISPSFEGCNNSIIEALNNDLVVIALVVQVKQEVLSNGKSGVLFITNSEYDLSLKIKNYKKFYKLQYKYSYQNKLKIFLKKNVRNYIKVFNSI